MCHPRLQLNVCHAGHDLCLKCFTTLRHHLTSFTFLEAIWLSRRCQHERQLQKRRLTLQTDVQIEDDGAALGLMKYSHDPESPTCSHVSVIILLYSSRHAFFVIKHPEAPCHVLRMQSDSSCSDACSCLFHADHADTGAQITALTPRSITPSPSRRGMDDCLWCSWAGLPSATKHGVLQGRYCNLSGRTHDSVGLLTRLWLA